ncbi:MAG: TIGR03086 family protein [Acidimicrobiia bacterium]|nr:TIGR03086 family protein [Acidimicrobiia bacterium]
MEPVTTLERVISESRRLVDGITPDQLANPTLCTEWTVRDVLNHITGGATYFGMVAEQGSVPDELVGQLLGGDKDLLGDDYKASFNSAADKAMAGFSEPGVLEKIVKLPFGEMPAGVALNIAIFDVSTHNCDIAQATGQPIQDTGVLETAIEVGRKTVQPEMRTPGFFDPEQPCADAASPEQRLLAFAGRKV